MKLVLALAMLAGSFPAFSQRPVARLSPPDFPMECHGRAGMASVDGTTLIVDFRISGRLAGPDLQPGSCAWRDRRFRRGEPARIVEEFSTRTEAKNKADLINAGNTWTFWVFNTGRFFWSTVSESGAPKDKPMSFEY